MGQQVRQRRRRPTLKDVSAQAGVSIKTVSRVVNGDTNVTPALAERVRTAVESLGYAPDPLASRLRRGRGPIGAVAVVVEDVANPFSTVMHRAVTDAMAARGVVTLSASYDKDPGGERTAVLAFTSRRVDGVILMPTTADHPWLDELRETGTEVVLVDRPVAGLRADVVMSDHRAAARRATTHLLRHGHHRIGFLADAPDVYTTVERLAGFDEILTAAAVAGHDGLVRDELRGAGAAEQAVIDLLAGDDPPTALIAGQNLLAIGAFRALRRLNLHHRIALVSLDDIPLADLLDPGITVVAQEPERIGALAAQQLLGRIAGDHTPATPHLVPTQLIPRGSGEIPGPFLNAADTPEVSAVKQSQPHF
ncbi:LacI family DNA-binding transcriptional regulator [Kocuria marina]|uniref:LacI family DNA-binding transcriptional regulator n=1 Tax=Kocuria marina TaxID=223184 RepID=UPI0016434EA4|nr:LacI family DNA-binding transcriptional regulator [Kocuria indica]